MLRDADKMVNRTKEKLLKGEASFGTWIALESCTSVDLLRRLGYEWFVFDMEHSPLSIQSVSQMIHVLNDGAVTPLVRVGQLDQALAKVVLDSGSMGIVFPMVNTSEDATRAVRYCKYPPEGVRGAAIGKSSGYGLNYGEYLRNANRETLVVVQLETLEALKNIDSILEVPGIDVAFAGPSDLTVSLGLLDDRSNPKVQDTLKGIAASCRKHGKASGIMANNLEEVRAALKNGFTFISLGSDIKSLALGASQFLEGARKK